MGSEDRDRMKRWEADVKVPDKGGGRQASRDTTGKVPGVEVTLEWEGRIVGGLHKAGPFRLCW